MHSHLNVNMEPSERNILIRIVFAVIGTIVGVSILFCFGIVYNNWNCAVWGVVSGVFAFTTLLTHLQYRRDKWTARSFLLRPLMYMGCMVQLVGVCAFCVYLTIAIYEHQKLTGYGRGFYVTAVWCAMTWKWGFQQFFFSRNYYRLYTYKTGQNPDVPYEKV